MNPIETRVAQLVQKSRQGLTAAAERGLRDLAQANPSSAEPCVALAQVLGQLGEQAEAMSWLEEARSREPGNAKVWVLSGALVAQLGSPQAAIPLFEEALRLQPGDFDAEINLAESLHRSGEREEGLRRAEALLLLHPTNERLVMNVHAYRREHDFEGALRFAINKGRELEKPRCLRNAACEALYSDQVDAKEIAQLHQELGERYEANIAPTRRFKTRPELNRPIRVGILSSDLRRHSVAHFLLGWLGKLEADRIQVSFYMPLGKPDDFTARFEQFGQVQLLGFADARTLASAIYEQSVDVLFELNGLTEGGNLALLAMKPAPVVISGIGYPFSTGLSRVDCRWVDELTDPEGGSEWMAERALRVAPPFLCYHPVDDLPQISAREPGEPVVFGSFNNSVKITRGCVAIWSEALRLVKGAKLVLKPGGRPGPEAKARMMRWFVEEGVADRVRLLDASPTVREHLELYSEMDIALDTWPYNGATTTVEALMMGVPVVASWGDGHRARVSAALLKAAGRTEWIAETPSETPLLAARLAEDVQALRANREALRHQILASPICDAEAYAEKFTKAIEEVWRRHVEEVKSGA